MNPAVMHRILGDQVELLRFDSDIAQSRRQAEPGDQSGDDFGCRFAGPAERLADPRLFFGVDQMIEAQHVGQHDAGGIPVRHTRCAAEHMPDPVAGAFADAGLRADHRHPGADLAVEPGVAVLGVCFYPRQAFAE